MLEAAADQLSLLHQQFKSLAVCADAQVGKYYGSFIYPYKGTYGSGSPMGTNRFWPITGNHDVIVTQRIQGSMLGIAACWNDIVLLCCGSAALMLLSICIRV